MSISKLPEVRLILTDSNLAFSQTSSIQMSQPHVCLLCSACAWKYSTVIHVCAVLDHEHVRKACNKHIEVGCFAYSDNTDYPRTCGLASSQKVFG